VDGSPKANLVPDDDVSDARDTSDSEPGCLNLTPSTARGGQDTVDPDTAHEAAAIAADLPDARCDKLPQPDTCNPSTIEDLAEEGGVAVQEASSPPDVVTDLKVAAVEGELTHGLTALQSEQLQLLFGLAYEYLLRLHAAERVLILKRMDQILKQTEA
jgi:hypothetical protein